MLSNCTAVLIFVKVEWQNTDNKCPFFSLDSIYRKKEEHKQDMEDRKDKEGLKE